MRLADALRTVPGKTIAFVGAGGKSAAIQVLVRELAGAAPVLVTTTTKLALEQSSMTEVHLVVESLEGLRGLEALLTTCTSLLLTGPQDPREGKWTGLAMPVLSAAHRGAMRAGAVMLIEADGARGRSLKAPAAHEPVVPGFTDVTVPVAGLDVLGERLDSPMVHRPERVAALLGLTASERVQSGHLAHLLTHPEGGLKGVPPGCEVRVLLNKVDDEPRARRGVDVGQAVMMSGAVRAVVLASLASAIPVREVIGRVAGVVLAAGGSTRLRTPKQLVAWRGRPLVWHAVRAAVEGGLDPVVVVVGAHAGEVRQALSGELATIVDNPAWTDGQSTSMRGGLAAVESAAEAIVFLLADTPLVDRRVVHSLVQEHRRTLAPIVAPRAGGRWATPVLFDRSTFAALAAIEGDRGGRALFGRYPVLGIDWSEDILLDVDTPEDLARLEAQN